MAVMITMLVTYVSDVFSQQDPMYTHYMFNTLAVNPAYAGSRGMLNVSGLFRTQWVGLNGAPTTQTAYVHSPFLEKKMGLGLTVVNDKIGPINQTMFFGDYSYTIQTTEKTKLAFGLKAGFNMLKVGLSDVNTNNATTADQAFQQDIKNKIAPNFGFGMYYYSDLWYVGVSTPKLIENKYANNAESDAAEKRHFFVIGGYVFNLNESVKFKPAVLGKFTDGAPVSIDLTTNFLFHEKFWLGAAYRFGDSFSFLIELQVTDQLRVGYSYDYNTSQLKKVNSGSHEIMLSYDFQFSRGKIISPRYF
ncbi:MAG TPA: hypothetical protein DEH02_03165 [Bacteroidales bacterium]|nr:hypothetical protein [Bacteroidales bacterium]